MKNQVAFKVTGKYALFTDPLTKIGGEKCSYHVPTYEALKGIAKSVYWKPTFIWIIDKVRVMNRIRTQTKGIKPLKFDGGNDLSIYTYLMDVEYQVVAHFEWNKYREDMAQDRNDGKHFKTALRMIGKGGRRDIFLGTRECQGYVESCEFGDGKGYYDADGGHGGELAFGVMFHGFDYPDEIGKEELHSRFCRPVMKDGVIKFSRPDECTIRKFVRNMESHPPKSVGLNEEGLDQ